MASRRKAMKHHLTPPLLLLLLLLLLFLHDTSSLSSYVPSSPLVSSSLPYPDLSKIPLWGSPSSPPSDPRLQTLSSLFSLNSNTTSPLYQSQQHLVNLFSAPDCLPQQQSLLTQLHDLSSSYPGGISAYLLKCHRLLHPPSHPSTPSSPGISSCHPRIPHLAPPPHHPLNSISYTSPSFTSLESLGLSVLSRSAFVLVAGGLGERLSFPGSKLSIAPSLLLPDATYLSLVADYLHALAQRTGRPPPPLVLMTSPSTDASVRRLLAAASPPNFGLPEVSIVTQLEVPCISSPSCSLALHPSTPFRLLTAPHGHGDVHSLLSPPPLLPSWLSRGLSKVVFLQDANAAVLHALLAGAGAAERRGDAFTSICVPRREGEAAGGLALVDGRCVLNVEYDKLKVWEERRRKERNKDECRLPGNTNWLVVDLEAYCECLLGKEGEQGGEGNGDAESFAAGAAARLHDTTEFLNPKYVPGSNATAFKTPARLETLMQDLPLLFAARYGGPKEARVGYVEFEKWFASSPSKNSREEGAKARERGLPEATVGRAEHDLYRSAAKRLSLAGVQVEYDDNDEAEGGGGRSGTGAGFGGARVAMDFPFALTKSDLAKKLVGVRLSRRSTLSLRGKNVTLRNVTLDGAMDVRCANDGTAITVRDVQVVNDGCDFVEHGVEEIGDKVRGYKLVRKGGLVIDVKGGGEWVYSRNGLEKIA